jgi:hypothetical protein
MLRRVRLKIPPFDRLPSGLSLRVEDRVVSPSTSFRINEVEPPKAGVRGSLVLCPAKQTQSGLDELLQLLRLGRSDPIHFAIFHVKLNGHRAGYVIEPAAWYFSDTPSIN